MTTTENGPQPGTAPGTVRRPTPDKPWSTLPEPTAQRVTSRLRRVVDVLPEWEPLPPGEVVVRRPGSE